MFDRNVNLSSQQFIEAPAGSIMRVQCFTFQQRHFSLARGTVKLGWSRSCHCKNFPHTSQKTRVPFIVPHVNVDWDCTSSTTNSSFRVETISVAVFIELYDVQCLFFTLTGKGSLVKYELCKRPK